MGDPNLTDRDPMPPDVTAPEEGDDGAIFAFWAFILRRIADGEPEGDLDDLDQLRQAIADFEAS